MAGGDMTRGHLASADFRLSLKFPHWSLKLLAGDDCIPLRQAAQSPD
jgi:hypothetical protein